MKAILVGNGQIAKTHLYALRALGHEVEWVVGRDAARARAFSEAHGIPKAGADLAQALECGADTVHICTPPLLHTEQILQCLAAKKHVISEKPLCLSAEDAAMLATRARASECVTALCLNVRFYGANCEAMRAIRAGRIGRPLVLHGSYLQSFHAPPHADGWRFDPGQAGDQRAIGEIGTHWIDLAHAWTGQTITAVAAALGNWYPTRYRRDGMLFDAPPGVPVSVETEDAAAVALRFSDGAIGTLLLSEVSHGHFNDLTLEIAGTDGTLRWEELYPDALFYARSGATERLSFDPAPREQTFVRLFEQVYAAIAKKAHAPFPTFDDGAYLARVCAAIRKSGVDGGWVNV